MLPALLKNIRLWHWKRQYRPGRIISRFLAPDIRREVEVVEVPLLEVGVISARIRNWNVLFAAKGIVPEPPFEDVQKIEIKDLWIWSGESWGGLIPGSTDGESL